MVVGVLAFAIGFTAGLRCFTAPAAIGVAARWGSLHLANTWLAFLGYAWTPWLLTGAAVGEIVNDKLPNTPSRKSPPQFTFRIVSGALSGASVGAVSGCPFSGMFAGILGAIAGTFSGASGRQKLVRIFGGRELWAALSEDLVTILMVILVLLCVVKE
ncbi:Uncharacterized membrane protein [Bryocella elongata]|uniref:Uncharacterized membrane protein n=1 Tax=Bryocella elongata TaxID=863522 RepID=A0A1H5UXC7_9BACT|nr:DUF4126 family protein [Bryocella elongata]SEF79624.1 Uncharacterized membrane protein [Bryocella elongata]